MVKKVGGAQHHELCVASVSGVACDAFLPTYLLAYLPTCSRTYILAYLCAQLDVERIGLRLELGHRLRDRIALLPSHSRLQRGFHRGTGSCASTAAAATTFPTCCPYSLNTPPRSHLLRLPLISTKPARDRVGKGASP